MSLGSHNPEKFTEARHHSVARLLVSARLPGSAWRWPGKTQDDLEDSVVYALDDLSMYDHQNPDNEPGRSILYDALVYMANPRDVLDRFYDSIGL